MYGKTTVTGVAASGILAVTGRPVFGLVVFAAALILVGLLLLRAVSIRSHR